MPYRRNTDLPESVKVLPSRAQTIWRNIFNNVEQGGASEESAFRQAWGGLKNQGWEKDPETGQWHKVEKSTIEFPISKIDEERRLVFGWANVSVTKDGELLTDLQGDRIDIYQLEKAVYPFVIQFGAVGKNHEGGQRSYLVESMVFTPEKLEKMGIPEGTLPLGWWIGAYVPNDEDWEEVKMGQLAMFSVQGKGFRRAA